MSNTRFTVTARVIETGEVLLSHTGLSSVRAETRQDTVMNRYDTNRVSVTITPDVVLDATVRPVLTPTAIAWAEQKRKVGENGCARRNRDGHACGQRRGHAADHVAYGVSAVIICRW